MATLEEAQQSVRTQGVVERTVFGPWKGSMRSMTGDQVPPEYAAWIGGSAYPAAPTPATATTNNCHYTPRDKGWVTRGGQTQKFDTFGAAVGMLPAKWSSRVRHAEEFKSDSVSDGVPTVCSLHTKETVTTGLDDGRFSTLWVRDQVNGYDYRLGEEYNTSYTYPAVGSTQLYRYIPVWYESGDGGLTRGVSEFARRFFLSGSRRFLKVGNWWYFPNRYGTPVRWDGNYTASALAVSGSVAGAKPNSTIRGGDGVSALWSSSTNGAGSPPNTFPQVALHVDCDEGFPADDATTFIRSQSNPTAGVCTCVMGLTSVIPATQGTYTVTYRALRDETAGSGHSTFTFQLYRSDGNGEASAAISTSTLSNVTWATYTTTITIGASPSLAPSPFSCTTNGTTTLTSSAQFGTLSVGMTISGTGIPSGTTITAIASTSSLTMSAAATDSTTTSRNFFYTSMLGIKSNSNSNFRVEISAVVISDAATASGTAVRASHLIPSGPFPPTHCGSLATGVPVTAYYMLPNGDRARGSWVDQAAGTSNIYQSIDEGTATNDADYVSSNGSNTTYDVDFASPATVPASTDTVTLRYRHRNIVGSGTNSFAISIRVGSTTVVSASWVFSSTTSWTNSGLALTATQITQITTASADWSDVYVRMTTSGESGGLDFQRVSDLYFEVIPASVDAQGGFKGKDRFFRGFYYRFEDGSIWALTTPRFPNSTLSSGLDLVTVDSANPDVAYTSITHQYIPIGPKGVIAVGICRTDKIDSSIEDNLELNATGFKLIAEVPNGTTSYVDYKGDDAALKVDVESYFIRYDHMMPPRARYIEGGDMRVIHSYGGNNPCAIVIAPVGRTADWDLNLAEDAAALYTSNASYMQIGLDSSGVGTLTLIQSDAATATDTKSITLSATMTLQDLCDNINATNCAVDGQQWRAQVAPFADPSAIALTSLVPHNRAIASCTVSGQTITASSGLSKVAVGQLITGTGVTDGAYVSVINSDTQLTFVGTIAAATVTLYFYNDLGDTQITSPATSARGFQRVISNSLPGFLYFNKTYLDTQTFDKASTWVTVAQPGSVKSAPNCFSFQLSNRFTPPLNAGICQGGSAVDKGFVIWYGNKIGAIRAGGPDSLLDQDLELVMIDETRGCCAWNTITGSGRSSVAMGSEGIYAADLRSVRFLSGAIYTDQPAAFGDFAYEAPLSVAATAADNDTSHAWARILRGVLWVGYRTGNTATHADARVRYDFSSGEESNGLEALFRSPGEPWGWSLPLTGSGSGASSSGRVAIMTQGRRQDGFHLYGWNDEHGGSTGDGRIDEMETGTTDNGSAYTSRLELPWVRPDDSEIMTAQEIVLEHLSPVGSTGSLNYHRSFTDDPYALTPGTSALGVYSELKFLPQGARANANAGYIDYRQATGSPRELRRLIFKWKRIPRYKT